jgi:hypothetical protein
VEIHTRSVTARESPVVGIAESTGYTHRVLDAFDQTETSSGRRIPEPAPSPIQWSIDGTGDRYFATARVVSTFLAYCAASGLIRVAETIPLIPVVRQTTLVRQEWLFWVVALAWVGLIGLFGNRGKKDGELLSGYLRSEIAFLGFLAGFYFAGLNHGQVAFFLLGSLLYLPVWLMVRRVAVSVIRSAQPIRHDARILIIG